MTDYQYAPGNYLTSRRTATYTYGTYGQLEHETDGATSTDLTYDSRRQLSGVTSDGSIVANFFYDALGRRIEQTENGTSTITLYDGNDVVYELSTPDGGPTTKTRYLPLDGQYLAKVVQEGTNPEQKYFYHTDLVGSVRAVTDISGQTAAHYDYEPFGSRSQTTGWMSGLETHRFTGKPQDGSTTLYNYGARYYSPGQGRFMTTDTWTNLPNDERGYVVGANPAGYNRYAYVLNNPLLYGDPTGHEDAGASYYQ